MKVGKIEFANNLHPEFKSIIDNFATALTENTKREIRNMKRLRLELLVISANSIITGIMDGKYGTMEQAIQAIEDWRAGVMAEGIKL